MTSPTGHTVRAAGWSVVHGVCPLGADAQASAWARTRQREGWPVVEEPHPADWSSGRGAGFRRNEQIVALGADAALAFIDRCAQARCLGKRPHGSHGAVHCATVADRAGISVLYIRSSGRRAVVSREWAGPWVRAAETCARSVTRGGPRML